MTKKQIKNKLAEIRASIEAENISCGEILQLHELAEYIDKDDMLLRQWAGIPEYLEISDYPTQQAEKDRQEWNKLTDNEKYEKYQEVCHYADDLDREYNN